MASTETMKIKVILGNDIRRWRYTLSQSKLSSLNEFVSSSFNLNDFWLQYEDDEGDRITLSSNNDFEDAITCAHDEDRKSLKIYIIQGSIHSVHQKQSQHSQQPLPPNPSQSSPPHSPRNGPCQPDPKCFEMKAAAIDFLTNPEIVKLLPDLHRRIFEQIKISKLEAESTDNKQANNNEEASWDSPENIEKIIRDLLSSESKFKPIVSHELYHKKLDKMIPCIAIKISTHLPILMNFSCEAIAAWIPHLANVLCQGFNTYHVEQDADSMPSAMSSFFPLMCSFMSSHGDYSGLGGFCEDRDSNGDIIHHGVQCDLCGTRPIRGARFKCLHCRNFDLCGQCESFGKHDQKHPMIKFNHSVRNMAHPPFYGLHETLRHFGMPLPPHHGPPPHHPHGPPHGQHHPHHHWGHNQWRRQYRGRGGRHQQFQQQDMSQSQHPGMQQQGQQQSQYWQQDGGDHRQRHRFGHKWNRWNHPQPQFQGQSAWDTQYQSPWRDHGNNNNQRQRDNDNASVISSTISCHSQQTSNHQQGGQEKKIKVMADFVTDVTLPDRTYYPTDTVLTKTWKMRNNGEHEWGDKVELVFFKGHQSLTLEKRYPVINAKPGQEVEVSAVIKTPDNPGRYCSYYRLQRNGEYFGPRVWVDIFAVAEEDTTELNKNAMKKQNQKCKGKNKGNKHNQNNKGGRNGGNDKQQDKIIKLEKKEAKLEAKQLKLQAKQSKLANKMENVSKQLDAQNENANSQKLIQRQEKIQKQQSKIQMQMDKLQDRVNDNQRKQNNMNNNPQQPVFVDEQQLLDDIANAAVKDIEFQQNNQVPPKPADIQLPAISCVCSATLHKTSPVQAYGHGARVNCDICGKFCNPNQNIYHCPIQKHQAHPEGYDLCCSCAELQMQGFIPRPAPIIHPIPPQQPQQPLLPFNPPIQPQQPLQPQIPPPQQQPPIPVIPQPVIPPQQPPPPQQPFIYQAQLEQLRAMGFNDDDRIKAELIQQNGNVQHVANRLLQLQ